MFVQYMLLIQISFTGLAVANVEGYIDVMTSNQQFRILQANVGIMRDTQGGSSGLQLPGCVIADMDAGDTVHIEATVSGGTKIVSLNAGGGFTFFYGALIC